MTVFMLFVCLLILILLLAVSSVVPARVDLSMFELKRRARAGDAKAQELLEREELLVDVLSLQRALQALLLVIFVTATVAAFGWLIGVLVSVVIALEYGKLARIASIARKAQQIYEQFEPKLLTFIKAHPGIFKLFRSVAPHHAAVQRLESREELEHVVSQSSAILTSDEKKLITQSLQFDTRTVEEIMTPRGVIDSVPVGEVLGPLVLSDLHKTGHSRFPVINGDIDHIVGMLYIQNLLTIDAGSKTPTVEKAMEPRVFYIKNTQTLRHALAAFLRTHHHMFIVVNEFQETVGIVTLEDVIEALLGRKIIDEFDAHDDLRAVAARNPRGNNQSKAREDV
ncbi:CBS domain-containing protein [Streptomyces caniscabiei]|uniref:CBS domain-containing protein n=1 Tax=Streptomyces caniscabiei TaxID=2746961 RepID=UPI0029AA9D32|nr:CBS domain-containing protein [Streptomyces caniscabiei]MDX2776465.1 CBS domain-containing protein [Streptomyces caniscabiei]